VIDLPSVVDRGHERGNYTTKLSHTFDPKLNHAAAARSLVSRRGLVVTTVLVNTRVIITGGAGFIGTILARRLLAEPVSIGGAEPAKVDELIIVDLVAPPADVAADPRVKAITGDLAAIVGQLGEADAIFHLAGVVSGAAEADFDLGMHGNLDGTRALLEHARSHRTPPVLVFSSSLAVFGPVPGTEQIGVVGDDTLPRPLTSYGIQKFIGEQLVADYTRRGFVRGRSVRLISVTVRPGKPNAAASSFMSGIIREPLAGLRAPCPVPPDTPIAVSSPRRTLEGILRAAAVSDGDWGPATAVTLPALTTTPREMAAAMDQVAESSSLADAQSIPGGPRPSDLIDWTEDPVIGPMVATWPAHVTATRAAALGLGPDTSFAQIVREYLADLDR
jgi:D-erythronate 2-dehydrogenase